MYRNLQLYDIANSRHLQVEKLSDLKKTRGFTQDDLIHMYPVLRGQRLEHKGLCLGENVGKAYRLWTPYGKSVRVINWIAFAHRHRIHTKGLLRVLNKEVLHHNGFCLLQNKEKVPKVWKRAWTFSYEGMKFETDCVKTLAKEFDINYECLRKVACGAVNCHQGWRLEDIEYSESYNHMHYYGRKRR